MPSLPIPAFAALLLAFLGILSARRGTTPRPTLALIFACALQAALVAGRLHYGLEELSLLQPVLAMSLPPLAWVAFLSATSRPLEKADLWHLSGPAFAIFCRVFIPDALDPAIPASFFVYGTVMLLALRGGARSGACKAGFGRQGTSPLGVGRRSPDFVGRLGYLHCGPDHLWRRGLAGLSLVALGGLMLAEDVSTVAETETAPAPTESDTQLVHDFEAMMQEKRLWLDPDLTLARIARRMQVPAKSLSAAVNRVKGENISRIVNGWRITHAAELLSQGQSVTEAMLASGFNTKSNFNREFLRIKGKNPSDWMRANAS